jgi:hypothetical protein
MNVKTTRMMAKAPTTVSAKASVTVPVKMPVQALSKAAMRAPKATRTVDARQLAWTSGSVAGLREGPGGESADDPGGGPERGRTAPETVTLNRAREELGLDFSLFELALQLGEIRTVPRGAGQWRVPVDEVTRLRDAEGHPQALLDRLRLVTSTEGAAMIGISRDRLVRLARLGLIRPVRWYVNRYRALVWVYLGQELREFAAASPALLEGRLPAGLREAPDAGEDQRARGWRSRRVAQLVRDSHDAWEEAAVWAALLGPEVADEALPDPLERARLRDIRAALPPGRPGPLASPELIRGLTTADDPDEIALALIGLADALGRARSEQPAPPSSFTPDTARHSARHTARPPRVPSGRLPQVVRGQLGIEPPRDPSGRLHRTLRDKPPIEPPRRQPDERSAPPAVRSPDPTPPRSPAEPAGRLPVQTPDRPAVPAPIESLVPARERRPVPPPTPSPAPRPDPLQAASQGHRPVQESASRAAPRPSLGAPGRHRSRRGLRGLLRGRRSAAERSGTGRSAADLAEEPFLHHRDQETSPPVEDLPARQTAGARRDR